MALLASSCSAFNFLSVPRSFRPVSVLRFSAQHAGSDGLTGSTTKISSEEEDCQWCDVSKDNARRNICFWFPHMTNPDPNERVTNPNNHSRTPILGGLSLNLTTLSDLGKRAARSFLSRGANPTEA